MLEREFLGLELSHLRVDVRSSQGALGALLSDEFFEFGRSGRTYSKAEMMTHLGAYPLLPGGDCSPDELLRFRAARVAPEVVLVTYLLRGTLRSSLWRREGQSWRVFFHQGTPVAEPPAAQPNGNAP
jgi:hypothetical protein